MCGIFGILSKKSKKFDYPTFCTLGVANDARGGDSVGVFIDGKSQYGVDNNKLFRNYITSKDCILGGIKKSKIALGHCRKASVGAINEKTAQPVIIKGENGNPEFVVIHNGTIHNFEELAKKHIPEIDITGMTDSQVMAHIFYHKGYDVLSEYNGGAVFVITDYRKEVPTTYMWKGVSKEHSYSVKESEERPLYLVTDQEDNELVFSSIPGFLLALRPGSELYTLKDNILCKFDEKNGFGEVKLYSRKNQCQKSQYPKYSSVIGNSNNYSSWWDYEYDYNKGASSSKNNRDNKSIDTSRTGSYEYKFIVDNPNFRYTNRSVYLHGRHFITEWGKIEDRKNKANYEIWFFRGVPLKSRKYFRILYRLETRYRGNNSKFFEENENLIYYLSLHGVYRDKDKVIVRASSPKENTPFTGRIQLIGDLKCTTYVNGRVGGCSYESNHDITYKKLGDESQLDTVIELYKTIKKSIL